MSSSDLPVCIAIFPQAGLPTRLLATGPAGSPAISPVCGLDWVQMWRRVTNAHLVDLAGDEGSDEGGTAHFSLTPLMPSFLRLFQMVIVDRPTSLATRSSDIVPSSDSSMMVFFGGQQAIL